VLALGALTIPCPSFSLFTLFDVIHSNTLHHNNHPRRLRLQSRLLLPLLPPPPPPPPPPLPPPLPLLLTLLQARQLLPLLPLLPPPLPPLITLLQARQLLLSKPSASFLRTCPQSLTTQSPVGPVHIRRRPRRHLRPCPPLHHIQRLIQLLSTHQVLPPPPPPPPRHHLGPRA
jgi:hypothetical protein